MRSNFIKILMLFSIFLFTACGGATDSGESSLSSTESIEIKTNKTILDPSEKKFYLEFSLKSLYPNGAEIELSNISIEMDECSISKSSLDGRTIKFTKANESQSIGVTLDFYSTCTPKEYLVKADSYATFEKTTHKSLYNSGLQVIKKVEENLVIANADSTIKLQAVDGSSRIGLNETKRYKLLLGTDDSDTKTTTASSFMNENVKSVTIISSSISKLKLIEPSTYRTDNEEEKKSLTFKTIDSVDFYIRTSDISGGADVDVSIEYMDSKNIVHTIKEKVYITILSSQPTAFSINDAGTAYNSQTKWFEQKFLISASDKYSNTVNNSPKINISAMADFRDKNGDGERILYGKFSSTKGRLIASTETNSALFEANSPVFDNINPERDFLLLFGNVIDSEALGKWDIDLYNNSSTTLTLRDSYYGKSHDDLGFAVGHNYIKDICSNESKEWELKIDSSDGTYELNEEGEVYVTLKFPPYLIGKTIAIAVNFLGDKRAGEVHFETLRYFGGVESPPTITIDTNTTRSVFVRHNFNIAGIKDTIYVRNANINCDILTNNMTYTITKNKEIKSASDCDNGETSFWEITARLIDTDNNQTGSMSFGRCQVSSFLDF